MIMGRKVGPASGQSTPWGILGWGAYYARVALPAVMHDVVAVEHELTGMGEVRGEQGVGVLRRGDGHGVRTR